MQRRGIRVGTAVAGDHVQIGHGHIEGGFVCVLQLEELGFLAFHAEVDQSVIATDAMVDMHHRCAFTQLG